MGDTSFLFSLSLENLTEALGAYGVTFTNVAGSVSVLEIRVVGPGMENVKDMLHKKCLEDASVMHIYPGYYSLYTRTIKNFLFESYPTIAILSHSSSQYQGN